jgi:hypothetical protein
MSCFVYKYEGVIHESSVAHYIESGCDKYKVELADGLSIVVAQAGMRTDENKIIWVQSHITEEVEYAHDLVQAIGEGIESMH